MIQAPAVGGGNVTWGRRTTGNKTNVFRMWKNHSDCGRRGQELEKKLQLKHSEESKKKGPQRQTNPEVGKRNWGKGSYQNESDRGGREGNLL